VARLVQDHNGRDHACLVELVSKQNLAQTLVSYYFVTAKCTKPHGGGSIQMVRHEQECDRWVPSAFHQLAASEQARVQVKRHGVYRYHGWSLLVCIRGKLLMPLLVDI
jgi:hypothetical protein